jgi:hypothetical protein
MPMSADVLARAQTSASVAPRPRIELTWVQPYAWN